METFTLEQARSATASGGVLAANLRPIGSAFALEFEMRSGVSAVLVASVTKKVRKFANLIKALEIVQDLGLEGGRYSVAEWHPDQIDADRATRPDRAAAMRQTHETASWIKSQIDSAYQEHREGRSEVEDAGAFFAALKTEAVS
jgi:hypothetical protein